MGRTGIDDVPVRFLSVFIYVGRSLGIGKDEFMKKIYVCIFILMIMIGGVSLKAHAANITDDDCSIGGVKAGWYSSHHYLPEKFNKTALNDVEWAQSSLNITLDNYPQRSVVGFGAIPCERKTFDNTMILFGVLSRKAQSVDAGILEQLFDQDPLYISGIYVEYNPNMNTSYKLLATDLATPRGIKIFSSKDALLNAYGNPDYINNADDVDWYVYFTPYSLNMHMQDDKYWGACIMFAVQDNLVSKIFAINTYGYPEGY